MHASDDLFKDIRSSDICLIQEPPIRNNRIPRVPLTHKQFVPFSKERARVAQIIPKDLAKTAMSLGSFNSRDCLVLRLIINKQLTILLASIYMETTDPLPEQTLARLCDYAEQENLPLVICTDGNSHHTSWGHRCCNTRGRQLLLVLNSNNLLVNNTGNTPTFRGHQGSSCIDLTLSNPLAVNLISNWVVQVGKSASDHELITFDLNLGYREYSVNRSAKRCDWGLFSSLVEQSLLNRPFWFKPVYTQQDLNNRQQFIDNILVDSFNQACPIIRVKSRSTAPWWTPALNQNRIQVKKLRRTALRTDQRRDWDTWSSVNKQYKKHLSQARNLGWKNFCSSIEGSHASSRIAKVLNINNKHNGELNSLLKLNGELTTTPQETVERLSSELIPDDGAPLQRRKHETDHALINQTLSPNRLERAMKELKKLKAPGPDLIRNQMIINAWSSIKSPLRNIFHNALASASSPDTWWETTGCIIAKPNKSDYTNPRSFRIISLTSAFQKLLERLVLWQIESVSGISVNLTRNQHGFRKGSSTESAIHNLVRRIEDANSRGNFALGVFLDIEGAFDNISFNALGEALIDFNIPPTFVDWISHLISNRFITISYCGFTLRKKATKGCPQGGVLSPLLWNITLNSFLSKLGLDSSFIQAFADDLVILLQGICKSTLRDLAQGHLNGIDQWCKSKGLKLSEVKTKIILFTNKQDNTLPNPIRLNGEDISLTEQTTYLGVIFDHKLCWVPHITAKLKKGISCLQACARAIGKTWGITPTSIRWLYNQVILPSVSYAAFAWYKALATRQYLTDLANRLQRHAALLITRGLHSTPTANLEILAGLPPITLTLQELAIKTARRLQEQGRWNSNYSINLRGNFSSHAYHTDKILKQLPITSSTHKDYVSSFNILDRTFKTITLPRAEVVKFINTLDPAIWSIYTDGSKRDNLTGAGFCVKVNHQDMASQSFSLGSFPTVYQCELFALFEAAGWALGNIAPPSSIVFFSDSQAVINTINSTKCNNTIARDTINTLNRLGTQHSVTIHWVPGHSDIPGNEAADKLARRGSATMPIGPEPFLPFSKNHSNTEIRNLTHRQHLGQYAKQDISEKGKVPLSAYLSRYRYTFRKLGVTHLKWLTWILSGHSPLFYFQHKIGKAHSPLCDFCQSELETSEHFLGQCAGYATIRLRTLEHITMTWADIINCKPGTIIKFIKATHRFDQDRIFSDRTVNI